MLSGLKFTALGLRSSQNNPSEELAQSFTKAYESSLKPYHSFVVKGVFSLAMKACPYRATFYPKLGEPQSEVQAELKQWLDGLDKIIAQMSAYYKQGNYGQV